MNRVFKPLTTAWMLLAVLALTGTTVASAHPPEYWVLGERTRPNKSQHVHRESYQPHRHHYQRPARIHQVNRQSYAYGWFGVERRKHPRRSSGYYQRYTQWAWK